VKASDGRLHFKAFDLSDLNAIPEMVRDFKKEFGPLYGLVNNAALGTEGLLSNMHVTQIEELVKINTISPIVLSKHAMRAMMTAGEGRIVNISSIIASTGYSGLSVYGATKASMIGFTKSLAREVGRLGITVNAVAPGFMDTEMTQSLGDEHRAQIARRSALQRLVNVEDIANAVAFLMSDGARNITGTVMTVDAGNTA
jgi:3-oxoacyl-[acyl-carrier protein] reductase